MDTEMMQPHNDWLEQALELDTYKHSDYYRRSASRYLKTLEFAEALVSISNETHVAEVGPGLILPMLTIGTSCQASAYGFANPTMQTDFQNLGVQFHQWDFQTPLPEESVVQMHDVVFFLEVIEHILRYPVELLSDLYRLVKPGGILIVTTVNFLRFSNRIRVLFGHTPYINQFVRTVDGRNHLREYSLPELLDYTELAGFTVLDSQLWNLYNNRLLTVATNLSGLVMPSLCNYMAIAARRQ